MNALGEIIGEICKVVLPIPEKYYTGNSASTIAICTLSSMDLLKKLSNSQVLLHTHIIGRLLSENRGIDSIIRYVNEHHKIKTIVVCGKEVWGHKAGHSLFELHQNGVDKNHRIINSKSPDPFLTVLESQILYFQNSVSLVNLINETDVKIILKKIKAL